MFYQKNELRHLCPLNRIQILQAVGGWHWQTHLQNGTLSSSLQARPNHGSSVPRQRIRQNVFDRNWCTQFSDNSKSWCWVWSLQIRTLQVDHNPNPFEFWYAFVGFVAIQEPSSKLCARITHWRPSLAMAPWLQWMLQGSSYRAWAPSSWYQTWWPGRWPCNIEGRSCWEYNGYYVMV